MPPFEQVYADYTPNCIRIANEYHRKYGRIHDIDDLFQEATIGLWQAYERCTDARTFPGLAKLHIAWSVRDYCKGYNHLIRIPHTNGMTRGVCKAYSMSSLSSPVSTDAGNGTTLADIIPDNQAEFEGDVANNEIIQIVGGIAGCLNDKDFEVIGLYLLCGGIVKLAEALGVHHNTARKRLNSVLVKLRAHLELVDITSDEVYA